MLVVVAAAEACVAAVSRARLKSMAGDLGGAVKGFKKAMDDDDDKPSEESQKRLDSDEQDAEFPERKKNKSRTG